MVNKLNEIKGTLKEQRRIAEESEQRKNDIIVYLAHDEEHGLFDVGIVEHGLRQGETYAIPRIVVRIADALIGPWLEHG